MRLAVINNQRWVYPIVEFPTPTQVTAHEFMDFIQKQGGQLLQAIAQVVFHASGGKGHTGIEGFALTTTITSGPGMYQATQAYAEFCEKIYALEKLDAQENGERPDDPPDGSRPRILREDSAQESTPPVSDGGANGAPGDHPVHQKDGEQT